MWPRLVGREWFYGMARGCLPPTGVEFIRQGPAWKTGPASLDK